MIPKWKIRLRLIVCLLMAFGAANHARTAEIENVTFKDHITLDSVTLPLRGTGLFRYMVFVKAYVGALYMPEDIPSRDVLTDIPKHLVVEYFHAIKGEAFGEATNEIMAQNLEAESLERLRPRIAEHNALYKDVEPGDRYSLSYIPGKGTELALNGNPLGVVKGADFAAALYGMWLGENPMNSSFKEQLLGAP
jgi:hypothetical protein